MSESETEIQESGDEISSPKSSRKKRSLAYQHFDYEEESGNYHCKICRSKYHKKSDGSTSALVKHLRATHPSLFNAKNATLDGFVKTEGSKQVDKIEPFTAAGLRKRIMEVTVLENLPFRLAEKPSFQSLIKYCNSQATFPCANTIKSDVEKLYLEKKIELKGELMAIDSKISFIIDAWTSANQKSYLGVIAQWIDTKWDLQIRVLDLLELEGSHTGERLAVSFMDLLDEYEISSKILGVTADNAGNMNTFAEALERKLKRRGIQFTQENNRIRCLAHIVNLICQAAIDKLEKIACEQAMEVDSDPDLEDADRFSEGVITKLRHGVVKIRSSPQRLEAFRRQCEVMNIKHLELIRDIKTRWNSTYDMITRALKMKQPYSATLQNHAALTKYRLSDLDWSIIEQMQRFLEVRNADFRQKEHLEQYISDEEIGLEGIDSQTSEPSDQDYPSWLQEVAIKAMEKLVQYYPTSHGLAYIAGTVFDPRLKFEWYEASKFGIDAISGYRKRLTEKWATSYKKGEGTRDKDQTADVRENIFEKQLRKMRRLEPVDEFDKYCSEKTVDSSLLSCGALGWWKVHAEEFPQLSAMAKDFLAVAGSGVPVESIF
ncbi:putative AC9 transposase [Folsomia candida]|uniref:Putative AC9 transposase n=1 Tax=Folsomia candida TaxID=158441 RepID=A0A226DTB2_FOLCA|nr:putative AC9 transposase [Folsomia candida]